jgi:hypothetical protein
VTVTLLLPPGTTTEVPSPASDAACARIPTVQADARYRCVTSTFFPG